MKKTLLAFIIVISLSTQVISQNVGIGTNTPIASSILELKSTTKGVLLPRMSQAERLAITSPAQGLLVYQLNIDTGFYYYSGNGWKGLAKAGSSGGGTTQLNKIFYGKSIDDGGGDSHTEIWTANYDGSNQAKINITLPAGFELDSDCKLSPDGLTLIFLASDENYKASIFACNPNGTNVHIIVDGSTASSKGLTLEGVY